uniref:uncharacterized protein n=1 Tax=Centroberyx gerrardi TaxID=166262 RepID=UPI003AAF11F3
MPCCAARCGEQRESRGSVEAELSDLRLMEEELVVCRLPDLHRLLRSHTQELSQLQQQHQQDVQGLLAQVSGGVAVEMQCAESSDVRQQLEEIRQKSEDLLNKNQTKNSCWFHSQVSMLSPAEASCRPSGSEVVGAELKELRRTALSLQAELEQIQALNVLLENSELELREGFSLQLAGLQQRADSLGSELDSVLEATGRQATDYQTLLDIKTRLETEIQNYRRLLDGQSNRVSSSSSDSMAGVTSFCTKTNGAAFQSKAMLDKTAHVERGNLEAVRAVQTLTEDHISPVRHAAVVKPLSQTVETREVHRKRPESSSLTSINTRSLTGSSLTSSESQRQGEVRGYPTRTSVGTLLNCTERESKTVSTMIDKQSSPLVDKVHTKAPNLNNTVIVGAQISQDVDEEVVIQASKPEINTVIEITRIAVDTPAIKEAALQATKPEINVTGMTSAFIHTQTTKETGMQATKTEMNTVTEITKTVLGTQITKEDDVKASEEEINVVREMTSINPGTKTAAEVEKDAVISTQTDCAEGHTQGISKGKDPEIIIEQVVSLGIESPRVTETDNTDITGKTQWIEKSEANVVEMTETREQREADIHVDNHTKGQVWWIVQKQSQVSTVGGNEVTVETVTVELDKINSISHTANTGNTEKSVKAETVSHIPNIEQSISTTYNSPKYSDKGVEDSNAVSHIPKAEQSLMTANISSIEHTEGAVKDAGAVSHSPSTGLSVSTSNVHESEQSEGEIFSEVTQIDEKEGERLEEGEKEEQGKKVEEEGDKTEMRQEEGASLIPKLEQSLSLCHTSNSKHNEDLIKDADTQSCIPTAEPYIPNSDKTLFADSVVASRVILRDGEKEEKKGVREGGVGREEREQEEQEKADMGESSVGAQEEVVSQGGRYRGTSAGDKEEVLGFGGLYRRSVGDREEVTIPGGRYKDTSNVDGDGVFSPVGSPEGRYRKLSLGDRVEAATKSRAEPKTSSWLVASATANNGRVFGKSASFGSVPATGGITFGGMASNAGGKISGVDRNRGLGGTTANGGGTASNIATSFGRFGGVVASGGGTASNISASFVSAASNSAGMIAGKGGNAETATGVQGRIRHSSGEWIVYGSSPGRVSSLTGSGGLTSTGSGDAVNGSMATHRAASPAGGGRFSSGGSGEWRVYGGGTGRVSSAGSGGILSSGASGSRVSSHRSSSAGSGGRLNSAGSGGRLSTSIGGRLSSASGGGRRSTSVGSGGRLSSSGSGGRLSGSAGTHRISSSGRFSSTGSGEWKPVYSGASGRRSSAGSGGRPSGTTSGHRAPSPGGRLSITGGSGGRLSSATVSGNRVSSTGSGSGAKLSSAGSSDRLSSPAGGRISSSSGSGRTNSTGGRVITSSDRPIRNTGSGAGVNKERISVCKMAALSMSAAGRERSKERQALRSQQQKAAASSPHVQRWLTTGVGVTGDDLDGLDDIIRL